MECSKLCNKPPKLDYPLYEALDAHIEAGGEAWHLMEPTDGFHPSQTANVLIAQWYWDQLITNHPDMLGTENPFNDFIKIFQDKDILTCDAI